MFRRYHPASIKPPSHSPILASRRRTIEADLATLAFVQKLISQSRHWLFPGSKPELVHIPLHHRLLSHLKFQPRTIISHQIRLRDSKQSRLTLRALLWFQSNPQTQDSVCFAARRLSWVWYGASGPRWFHASSPVSLDTFGSNFYRMF